MQCQQCRTPNRAGAGWRARGEIAMRQRRWDEAETALREALTLALALNGAAFVKLTDRLRDS